MNPNPLLSDPPSVESKDVAPKSEAVRILVVDDDEVDRMSILRALRHWTTPLEIVEASTGEAALEAFGASHFDAVLLDYRLPDMDGLDVLRRMTSGQLGSTAVIILTGMDNDALAEQCIEAGAQDFVLKQEISSRRLLRAIMHARMRHKIELDLLESREHLRKLAEQDQLTGLANRYFFDQSLRSAIARANRYNESLALLMLDLDDFKLVNDSQGHDVGDLMLRMVADRLREVVRDGDILCRLGGDEFAILTFRDGHDLNFHLLAERLVKVLIEPMMINGAQLTTAVSIGIAVFPENTTDAAELFKCADLAMYRAKSEGHNQICYFSEDLQNQVERRVQVEYDLRSAVSGNQLELFYQPQIYSEDEKICGAEALIRWNHPTRGLMGPGEFLDIAETTGQIVSIGAWVIETACNHMKEGLRRPDGSPIKVAVNISPRQIRESDIVALIRDNIERTGVNPHDLLVEVTESLLIDDLERTQAILDEVAALGVQIAIDDFGTGYSSLAYLKMLPLSTLKVDKSFLDYIPEGEKDCRMLKALIQMAHSMDFKVVVEGVETREQADVSRSYGADIFQGYYFAKPMPLLQLEERLKND